jgi:ribosomal protein S1
MQPSVAIGETIEGLLIASPLEREILLLSPRHLGIMRCEAALNKRRAISVEVANANRGGLLMDVGGLPGFLPRSELRPADAFSHAELVGRTIAAYVIGLSQQQTILSAFPPRARRRRRASRPHRL